MNQEQLLLRDIQPPLTLPEEPAYAVYVAVAVAVLVLLGLLYWFFRRRKKAVKLPAAHEEALADLIRARNMMTVEQGLQYAAEVSGILRKYIEKRFRIKTSRQTTREFFSAITDRFGDGQSLFSEEQRGRLEECLKECDMAKFARCTPDMVVMDRMESAVRNFIEETRETREGGN